MTFYSRFRFAPKNTSTKLNRPGEYETKYVKLKAPTTAPHATTCIEGNEQEQKNKILVSQTKKTPSMGNNYFPSTEL